MPYSVLFFGDIARWRETEACHSSLLLFKTVEAADDAAKAELQSAHGTCGPEPGYVILDTNGKVAARSSY